MRLTHWLTALAFAALLVSGVEVLLSHPRFYWGETGNVEETPLFAIPVPLRARRADRLRLRAARPERLEPLSALPVGMAAGAERVVYLPDGFAADTSAGTSCHLPPTSGGRPFDTRSRNTCGSRSPPSPIHGRTTCCSASRICS